MLCILKVIIQYKIESRSMKYNNPTYAKCKFLIFLSLLLFLFLFLYESYIPLALGANNNANITNNNIKNMKTEHSLKAVIGGSYRKHLQTLMVLKKNLEGYNINVLSPVGSDALNPKDEFIILDEDPVKDHRILQDSIFAKIRSASFHVVANVDGYIGSAAKMEIGYALAYGLQILTIEPVNDPNLSPYCRLITDIFPDALKGIKN